MQTEEEFRNITCVQLKLKNCKNETQFYNLIKSSLKNLKQSTDLICFPENLNLCLLFAQPDINTKSFRSFYENLIDKILSFLNLSFILNVQDLYTQKNIVLSVFRKIAKEYNTNIITGSFYEEKTDGVYNVIYAIDRSGTIIDSACKKDLVGLEKGLRIKSKAENRVVNFDFAKVGLSVCFDLNDKEYCSKYKCDILVAPSNGFRPFPGYPFDKNKETPQIQRAEENNYIVLRPYCAGWLGPLYFSGRSMIVGRNGEILAQSTSRNENEVLLVSVVF